MRKAYYLLLLLPALAQAQDKSSGFGVTFTGFAKSDFFYDSRQVIYPTSIREGEFLLFPSNVSRDANGKDVNGTGSFNFLSVQSRVGAALKGPDAFGAKTSGLIEADFFGNENASLADVNGLRLRHAFVKLQWTKTEIVAGQFWNPMFTPETAPGVTSFNSGAPFQPFARNPQMRLTQNLTTYLKVIGCLYSQRDFQSYGPDATGASALSPSYLRNSGKPDANLQLQLNPDSTEHQFNVGVDYKSLLPQLSTTANGKTYQSKSKLYSYTGFASLKLKFKPLTVKLYGIYAQNAADLMMIGGYVVKQTDAATGNNTFTNINTVAGWIDLQTNGKKFKAGLFAGYTKNLGAGTEVTSTFYSRGSNIDYVYRISPRIMFFSGNLSFVFETEYTDAAYGTANGDKKGGVTNSSKVANVRPIASISYKF